MKAITIETHGKSDVLKLTDQPDPKPGPNEVVVDIKAAGVNHLDIWVRNGNPAYPVKLPHILGSDGAGVVSQVGSDVEGVSEGDRVVLFPAIAERTREMILSRTDNQAPNLEIIGARRPGTYAEKVAVPDENIIPIPDNLSFEKAAAFPVAYLTAYHMLIGRSGLKSGETVVVVGASSGVGTAAIQIAKWRGANILAITSKSAKAEKLKSIGANNVFVTDTEKDFSKWVRSQTDGKGAHVVVEHVGPVTWDFSIKSLQPYGRVVTCGATTGPKVELDLRQFFSKDLSLFGARLGSQKEFIELAGLISDGKIDPVIDRVLPLKDASLAHDALEAGDQFGKLILKPGP